MFTYILILPNKMNLIKQKNKEKPASGVLFRKTKTKSSPRP